MTEQKHTPGPWIDSPNTSDAIISQDQKEIDLMLKWGGPVSEENLCHYGGFVICESVYAKNKPIIKAAPDLLEALVPLGRLADAISRLDWPDDRPIFEFDGVELTAGDVRRGAAAITKARREEEPMTPCGIRL